MDLAGITLNYFSFNIKEVEILVAVLVVALTTFLGCLVLFSNPRSWTSRFFFMLAIVLDSYAVVNYISLHPISNTPESQLFWIRIVMFVTSFVGPLLFMLVHTFPEDRVKLKSHYIAAVILLMSSTAVLALSPMIFGSIKYVDGEPIPVPGPGMPLFFADFIGLILLSFVVLAFRYKRAQGEERRQQFYLVIGIIVSFTAIMLTTVLPVVLFKNSKMVFLVPACLSILISFIAYAIIKHQLFGVKIVATNILVFILWIAMVAKLIVAGSFIEATIDGIVLFVLIVCGIFLMQSVRREVEQRQKLEKLAADLESANARLIELDKMKSEFLSFASHQIKAPLSAVKGFSTLIWDGAYGKVSPEIEETARRITESVDRTIVLVSDFLSVYKIEEGKMDYKFEKTNGVDMVINLVEELESLAKNKNLKFNFYPQEEKIEINADVQRIRQVFQNLIENAIKYTDKGFVKVKIHIDGDDFLFSVSDSGHGLTKELIPHLFEEFKRGDTILEKIEGTGLGLFIAHEIVEAHSGKIWAESEGLDKGSTFFVRIPLYKQASHIHDVKLNPAEAG